MVTKTKPREIVKSAKHALDVFEYFAVTRKPATVGEIAAGLDLPQSSVSILLSTLRRYEYLDYDRERRKYFPTKKVRALGDWITDAPRE
jgi:DNA-binding IclR family transcriptional regulator